MKYRDSTYNQMKMAMSYLDTLPIDNPDNAIWWCLHQVVWHKGVDRIRWILENKELVAEISKFDEKKFLFQNEKLVEKFWESVYNLKRIDR